MLSVVFLQLSFLAFFAAISLAYLPPNFRSISAADKMSLLLKNINEKPYDELPTKGYGLFAMVKIFTPSYLAKSYTWDSDEMIKGRTKLIHTYGSCGRVSLAIFDNATALTGIFAAGQKSDGIARLSLAKTDPETFIPGMAVKIPVSRGASHSLITMYSTAGQGKNKNFFANTFTNQFGFIGSMFGAAVKHLPGSVCDRPTEAGKLPVWTPASVDQNGNTTATPKAPEVINFIPTTSVGWSPDTPEDFRTLLAKIPVNTVLYTLAVKPSRDSARSQAIGQLVLKERFVASAYCDTQLHFQHHARRC